MITSLLETIFKDRLCKIAKGEGLASLLEMLLDHNYKSSYSCGKYYVAIINYLIVAKNNGSQL